MTDKFRSASGPDAGSVTGNLKAPWKMLITQARAYMKAAVRNNNRSKAPSTLHEYSLERGYIAGYRAALRDVDGGVLERDSKLLWFRQGCAWARLSASLLPAETERKNNDDSLIKETFELVEKFKETL